MGERELTVGFVLVAIGIALFWGAAHALSPGHGKAAVAGYRVGSRGTPRHALLLGVIVAVTHTAGVFALGAVALALSEFIVPETLFPWLNLLAAVLVVAVGIAVVRDRVPRRSTPRAARALAPSLATDDSAPAGAEPRPVGVRLRLGAHAHAHAREHEHHHGCGHHLHHRDHDHDNHHGHGHGDHGHHHVPPPGSGWRGLVGVGVSSGLVPCPTALVVLLAAISLQRIGFGLLLIVAFSVGLAATIAGIGLLAVLGKRLFARTGFDGSIVRALPVVSACAILALGVAMTIRALPAVL